MRFLSFSCELRFVLSDEFCVTRGDGVAACCVAPENAPELSAKRGDTSSERAGYDSTVGNEHSLWAHLRSSAGRVDVDA